MKLFETFKFPLKVTYTKIHDASGSTVLDVRGWGMLTGRGAMRLSQEEAIEIQDEYGKNIVDILNNAYQDHIKGVES